MKNSLSLLICICLFTNLLGQGYGNHWYFGFNASIDFNSGTPVVTNNSAMTTVEGCAAVSDYNGNLLFYTDGSKVYNNNHVTMPNGTGLQGNSTTSQATLIVRIPNDTLKYYVFSLLPQNSANGDLHYSIVDMTLDSARGDVINKNTFIGTDYTEKLTVAYGDCGVWVVTHKRDTSEFHAFFVDGNGIAPPVISDVGAVHGFFSHTGVMKISPDNTKLACAHLQDLVQLFDFDAATGVVSNPITLPVSTDMSPWGVCFSPNSKRLYVGEGKGGASFVNQIYQYNLLIANPTFIINSKTLIGAPMANKLVYDMQIGPDNKIYVARDGFSYLDAIGSPNLLGTNCNYQIDEVKLGTAKSGIGLPNEIKFSPYINSFSLLDTSLCIGSSISIDVTAPNATYDWTPKDGSVSCETCGVVTITPNSTTTYEVAINSLQGCYEANPITITVSDISCTVTIIQNVSTHGGNDGIASVAVANGIPNYTYTWDNGQNTSLATGLTAGSYQVTILDEIGCEQICMAQILEPPPNCEPCSNAESNDLDICSILASNPTGPLFSLDCDEGGIRNATECLYGTDPLEPSDDCSAALQANLNICQLINNAPDHPFAYEDCDNGGIPNIIECMNNGDPTDPADECAVAKTANLNICEFINFKTNHPMASLDCDAGGVINYLECNHGMDACEPDDDCVAAVRADLDLCAIIANDPNHPWASLDCDAGGVINITECMNGMHPSKPSDDFFCPRNYCAEAIIGDLDICQELSTDPNHPVGPLDCDGDGVTNTDECVDSTDPLDACDFVDTSITLPVTADQTACGPLCPDLTPIMTILPGNIAGYSPVEVAVQITELADVDTDGSVIIVRIPSDPRFVFVWNIGLTMAALVPVQNADWNYLGDNGFVHTWTYNGPGLIIPAQGLAAFGFQSFYDPQATSGQTTLTATILPFSGSECNAMNNTDSERLVYFK